MPDKAIDLIDEAASRVRINFSTAPLSVNEVSKMLEKTKTEKDEAISARQYEYAGELRDRETKLSEKLADLQKEWQEERKREKPVVTRRQHRRGRQHVDRNPGHAAVGGRD